MSDGDGGKNHRACQPSMRQFVVDSLLSMLFSSESRYANDASVSGRAERSWGNSELNKFRQTNNDFIPKTRTFVFALLFSS